MASNTSSKCIRDEDIPVLLTVFNRPEKLRAVVQNLRQIRPKRLFVAADGPRRDHSEDAEKCQRARLEGTNVDWDCHVETRFLNDNIGCDQAIPSAIDWFFQHVEHGIILEDDCIIHPHFFAFCGELLIRYSNDERIMQLSSLSPYPPRAHHYDYHFSRIFRPSGGWATWRRAWNHFTMDLHRYSDREALAILQASRQDRAVCRQKYKLLQEFKKGSLRHWSAWDVKWGMSCASQNGLNIVPENNLMNNIGFDTDSTHTRSINPVFENLHVQPLRFPIRHPSFVYADSQPERSLERKVYSRLPAKSRCMYVLRRVLGALVYLREVLPF